MGRLRGRASCKRFCALLLISWTGPTVDQGHGTRQTEAQHIITHNLCSAMLQSNNLTSQVGRDLGLSTPVIETNHDISPTKNTGSYPSWPFGYTECSSIDFVEIGSSVVSWVQLRGGRHTSVQCLRQGKVTRSLINYMALRSICTHKITEDASVGTKRFTGSPNLEIVEPQEFATCDLRQTALIRHGPFATVDLG
eukprot:1694548-Amphidinium_carterae.2